MRSLHPLSVGCDVMSLPRLGCKKKRKRNEVLDIWLAGQGGDGTMCTRHIGYASIWAPAILDDDSVQFHPLPQTPPLFSSKACDGQLPNVLHCVPFEWLELPSHTGGVSPGEDGGGVTYPSCAWCCPFTLWFIPPNNAIGRWSIYILWTWKDPFC